MRTLPALAMLVAAAVAASGAAAALESLPGTATAPDAAVPLTPSPDAPRATVTVQSGGSADGLPEGCETSNATVYRCSFTGTTQGTALPPNPVLVPEGSEIARFELPVGRSAVLEAVATGPTGDDVVLAIASGSGAYAATPTEETLRHARLGNENGTLTLVLARNGNAGGDWKVDVTVDNAPAFDTPTGFTMEVAGPSASQVPSERGLPCSNGYCVLGRDPSRRATDVPVGDLVASGTLVTVDLSRTGGAESAAVVLLDAEGVERASASLEPSASGAIEANATASLGTWRLRFATDADDAGTFTASGTIMPPPPPPPPEDVNVTLPNGTDPKSPRNDSTNSTNRSGGEHLTPHGDAPVTTTSRLLRVGYFSSAVVVGLVGVVTVALVTRKW